MSGGDWGGGCKAGEEEEAEQEHVSTPMHRWTQMYGSLEYTVDSL